MHACMRIVFVQSTKNFQIKFTHIIHYHSTFIAKFKVVHEKQYNQLEIVYYRRAKHLKVKKPVAPRFSTHFSALVINAFSCIVYYLSNCQSNG